MPALPSASVDSRAQTARPGRGVSFLWARSESSTRCARDGRAPAVNGVTAQPWKCAGCCAKCAPRKIPRCAIIARLEAGIAEIRPFYCLARHLQRVRTAARCRQCSPVSMTERGHLGRSGSVCCGRDARAPGGRSVCCGQDARAPRGSGFEINDVTNDNSMPSDPSGHAFDGRARWNQTHDANSRWHSGRWPGNNVRQTRLLANGTP